MRFDVLKWLLFPAIAIHNFEEWTTVRAYGPLDGGLLGWVGYARPDPSWQQLEVALALATAGPALVLLYSVIGARSAFKDWLVCLIACVFLANVFVPHIPASLIAGTYTPGVASAVVINLPLALTLLGIAYREGRLNQWGISFAILGGLIALPLSLAIIWPMARALA